MWSKESGSGMGSTVVMTTSAVDSIRAARLCVGIGGGIESFGRSDYWRFGVG